MDIDESRVQFNLDANSDPVNLQINEVEYYDSKNSDLAANQDAFDHMLVRASNSKGPGLRPQVNLSANPNYQWMLNIEKDVQEIREILVTLDPNSQRERDPLSSIMRSAERAKKRKDSQTPKDPLQSLLVDRIRAFFVEQAEVKREENIWYSYNELLKWVSSDRVFEQAQSEARQRLMRLYRSPIYSKPEERAAFVFNEEEILKKRQLSSLNRRLGQAVNVMILEKCLMRNRTNCTFLRARKSLFIEPGTPTWKYEEAIDIAERLNARREALLRKLDHLTFLMNCLKTMAHQNARNQLEASIEDNHRKRLQMPLLAIVIPRSLLQPFKVPQLPTKIKLGLHQVEILSRKPMELLCDGPLLNILNSLELTPTAARTEYWPECDEYEA